MAERKNTGESSNKAGGTGTLPAFMRRRQSNTGLLLPPLFFPSILLILKEEPQHGYSIFKKLVEVGIVDSRMDPSPVYKTLRYLETYAMAVSEHQESGKGPARKVYRLTDQGEETLAFLALKVDQATEIIKWFQSTYQELTQGDGKSTG